MRNSNKSLLFRNIASIIIALFFVGCEQDSETFIGADLIVDRVTVSNDSIIPLSTSVINIESVRSSSQSAYLLGFYNNTTFGELSASIATNLLLPTELSSGDNTEYANLFGDDYLIDAIVVTIPYKSSQITSESGGEIVDSNNYPNYELEDIVGNTEDTFRIELFELAENISTSSSDLGDGAITLNSNKVFSKSQLLYSDNFKANADDKFLVIDRLDKNLLVYDKDTLKGTNWRPEIRFKLDAIAINYLKSKLMENSSSEVFTTQETFESYFNGFYIQASSNGTDGHLMELSLASSKLEILYSNKENESSNEDLDSDGIPGEGEVNIKKTATYFFGSSKANVFERNYANISRESDRLFVQGAAGEEAVVQLEVSDEDLEKIRSKNWLVTKATISVFVDQQYIENIPERLYIYNKNDNAHVLDAIASGAVAVGGLLEYENKDGEEVPLKYTFSVTDYFSEVLKIDSESIIELGIKVYNETYANISGGSSSLDYNWNPKGVVLLDESDVHGEKKLQLELKFKKIN